FPGLKVLQFAFGGDENNPYLPHNYPRNCVTYTGTHDNNTILGWFCDPAGDTTQSAEAKERERQCALKYLGCASEANNWDFIRLALASVADMSIIPLQDIMGLGSEARMNRPGTTTGNWRWRFTWDRLTDEMKRRLKEMTGIYGRGAR
ncbi:MAG: 4-alpha-glucanotransferase, partial [Chloroflexi bacterium]|nr:4-alpha-glucanotransferase [Chloroflexota bacterium]